MSYLLGLACASSPLIVAVGNGSKVISSQEIVSNKPSAYLQDTVKSVLKAAEIELNELNAIAVSCGPGSFTGVRLGLSYAQGLAVGLGCSLVALPTLSYMAHGYRDELEVGHYLTVVMDARMGQYYWQTFESTDKGLEALTPPQVSDFSGIKLPLVNNDKVSHIVGDGSLAYLTVEKDFPKDVNLKLHQELTAKQVYDFAYCCYSNGGGCSPLNIKPEYVRNRVVQA